MKMRNFFISAHYIFFTLLLSACDDGEYHSPSDSTVLGGSVQGSELILSKSVSTFAGPLPSDNGTGMEAVFTNPRAITSDGTNLYVADFGSHTIRKIVMTSGIVTTFAGVKGMQARPTGHAPKHYLRTLAA